MGTLLNTGTSSHRRQQHERNLGSASFANVYLLKSKLSALPRDTGTHNALLCSFLTAIYLHDAMLQREEMVSSAAVGGKAGELSDCDLLTACDRT